MHCSQGAFTVVGVMTTEGETGSEQSSSWAIYSHPSLLMASLVPQVNI